MFGDWDDMRVFLAVARAGSLGAAAKALKVDPTTVGRRLSALEETTGARLITRTPEGVQLTAEGQKAVAAAEQMEDALGSLQRQLGGAGEGGVVRVTTTESFVQYLFRFLPQLTREHPELKVEFLVDKATLDLARGEADVAVRFARPKGEGVVGTKAGTMGWAIYGADSYLARKGPVDLGALDRHDVVAFDDSLKGLPGAVWLSQHAHGANVVLRSNSPRGLAEAVAAGVGISVIPCFIAEGNPLLRRLAPAVLAQTEMWIAVHADLKKVPRVRAVIDFLQSVFQRERALLAGEQ